MLTGSCFKLRTVHNIPVTSNKDGKIWNPTQAFLISRSKPQGIARAFHEDLARHMVVTTQLPGTQRA